MVSGVGAVAALDAATSAGLRLAAIERTGLVRRSHRPLEAGLEHALPVAAELRGLLPAGLPRGGTVAVAGTASTSLLMLLLAAASQAGAWCAVVGLPTLNPIAAAESGVVLDRLALLPDTGPEWSTAAAVLLDGLDVVAVAAGQAPAAVLCGRLAARARQRGSVLVPCGGWQNADLTLGAEPAVWEGLGQGRGRVQCREVSVVARGRGAATRPRRATLWLPRPSGLYAELRARQRPVAEDGRRLVSVPRLALRTRAGVGAAVETGRSEPNGLPGWSEVAS